MGKTTLAAKIVHDLCSSVSGSCDQDTRFKDIEALLGLQFVLHIVLRESTDHREKIEMIEYQIIDMICGEERAKALHLLQQIINKETCLVIQDGLDEWADPKRKLALPLMVSSHHQCTVLITTRSWRMNDQRIKNLHIDLLLVLEGVDDPFEQSKRILCCFNINDVYRKEFEKYIFKNSLEELLKTPMLVSLVVCSRVEGFQLTGSKCNIYALLLDCLFKKQTAKRMFMILHQYLVSSTQNICNRMSRFGIFCQNLHLKDCFHLKRKAL
ncbi:hypothetical protein DPMN_158754 [Dreissena polymorpha]|uniref:NACHT domain-containing protein n=1 Tax=Dreissena polymorpha TaxID=45954 RepID=A0A9D4EKC6_DREPO|nr:hypothetical protein DPMN_158754 [Dreissena polymorpha]